MLDYVIDILKSKIPGHPPEGQKQVDIAIKILTEGQAYLTKQAPKRIVFYGDLNDCDAVE